MAFGIGQSGTGFTLGGTNFAFSNGDVSKNFVGGNIKQFSGGNWNIAPIAGKDKLNQIRWTGTVGTDEIKTSLEGFRDSGTYSYTDGVDTFSRVVVLSLDFSFVWSPSAGQELWSVILVMEEYDQ